MNPRACGSQPERHPAAQPAAAFLLRTLPATLLLILAGCSHHERASYTPPPALTLAPVPATSSPAASAPAASIPAASSTTAGDPADLQYVATHPPLLQETGTASWYGPPYDRHLGANGQIFDQTMLSAAHRTLPMGSLLRVTNLSTGQSTVLRVTDRGPFIPGRVLDLSVAAAKAIGVWLPGTAQVRVEVFAAPHPIAEGGRWCVQVGAFQHASKALDLQHHLQRLYATANVIEFTGPTGHWVRIRPAGDDKAAAVAMVRALAPEEGAAFLVRLD